MIYLPISPAQKCLSCVKQSLTVFAPTIELNLYVDKVSYSYQDIDGSRNTHLFMCSIHQRTVLLLPLATLIGL